MAAQPEDYFQEVGTPGSATYMTAPGYTIGATTMNVQSTAGFPADTGVIFAVDATTTVNGVETQVPGSYCIFEGKVASATSLAGVSLLYSTPQNYPAGATTRVYITVSSQWVKRLVEGLLVSHTQFGTLKNNVIGTANIADDAVTNAEIADSAVLPENLLTGTGTSWEWQSWTPTLTRISGGTLNYAKYLRVGKTNICRFKYTFAGAGITGVDPIVSLPIALNADLVTPGETLLGTVSLINLSTDFYAGQVFISSTSSISFRVQTGTTINGISSTVPFTWGTGDFIQAHFMYEGI